MFIVVSLATLYLFGLGSTLNPLPKSKETLLENIGFTLGIGILINYSIFLLTQKLSLGLMVGIALALVGTLRVGFDLSKRIRTFFPINFSIFFTILLLLTLYYLKIFSEPLQDWDARSIWFFHARIIWAEGAINNISNWHHQSLQWSHPDYPKLIPTLAAQIGFVKGYWNEFLPKGSLFLMLLPPIFLVFSFARKNFSFLLLVLITFFSLNTWLWNGYMDGYLALYASTAVLLFGRYFQQNKPIDLYSGICVLGIISNIKNEGLLFCLCMLLTLMVIGDLKSIKIKPMTIKTVAISFLPITIWSIYKKLWNLNNDLRIDSLDILKRILSRITDGASPQLIFKTLFLNMSLAWGACALFIGLYLILAFVRKAPTIASYLSILVSIFYFSGLYSIYLLTPHDLNSHLSSSADRTMLTVTLCVLMGVFFLLFQIESKPEI